MVSLAGGVLTRDVDMAHYRDRQCSPMRAPTRWVAAACLLLPVLAACNEKTQAQAPAPPPPAVGVQAAAMKGVSRSAEFVGRIKAINTVQLRARVEGVLEQVPLTEGDEGKPRQLLYQIETLQYQAQLDQAKA